MRPTTRPRPAVALAVCGAVTLLLACGTEPESRSPAPPPPSTARSVTTSTASAPPPPTAAPTTTVPPAALDTPEDARRFLEERGVDPAELSREAAEQMRRRLHPAPSE